MSVIALLLPCSAVLLEGLLLQRLIASKLVRRYPFLTIYVGCIFLRDVSLFGFYWWRPAEFAAFYWQSEGVSAISRFLVNWEFFRCLFPKHSKIHGIAWKMLLIVEAIAVPCILLLSWGQLLPSYVSRFPSFEQYLSLCQAILLLVPATVAGYYHLAIGRQLRALGLGLGTYVSLCAANFAALAVFRGFYEYARLIVPVAFTLMIALWLWAFYQPVDAREVPMIGRIESKPASLFTFGALNREKGNQVKS